MINKDIISSKVTKIMYFRDKNNTPVGCLASKINGDVITIGVSSWCNFDTINKKIGRQLAIERMEYKPITIHTTTETSARDVVSTICKHIIHNYRNFSYAISTKVVNSIRSRIKAAQNR